MANRVSQTGVEVVRQGNPKARVSQAGVEVVRAGNPKTHVSQAGVEVVRSAPVSVRLRVSQFGVEVVRSAPRVSLPFIASVTSVHAPALVGDIAMPFIGSATVVYAPTLTAATSEVDVPFIASASRVFGIMSLYGSKIGVGSGNGGERLPVRLAANGASYTATLAANIAAGDTLLTLTGDGAFPTDHPFVVTIDAEVIYVMPVGGGAYRVRGRGASNTTAASHTAGATVTWGDSYDMPLVATEQIDASFTADLEGTGSSVYNGWLMVFDSSQAYLGSSRYPLHVAELVGVFAAGVGSTGTNKLDGSQPCAVNTAAAASDDCPIGLGNPARIATGILTGDVALVRYTNPEASVLDLGPRSVGIQSWFGFGRLTGGTPGTDVTLTDPNGIVVDTTGGEGTFTAASEDEFFEPSSVGIAPDTGDPTTTSVPYTTVDLVASQRYYTLEAHDPSPPHAELGHPAWPIGALAVRQGRKRIPLWESWDWRDFSYVYEGFGDDCTFVQLVVNRNGVVFNSIPEVRYPNNADWHGPDAVWDDGDYYFAVCWYVAIIRTPFLVAGPVIAGTPPTLVAGAPGPVPTVTFGPGGAVIGGFDNSNPVEGGSGGNIGPPGAQLFQAAHV